MEERILGWFAEAARWQRWALAVTAAALVYLLGHVVVVGPLADREVALRSEAVELERRAAEQRRRVAEHRPVPESVRTRLDGLRAAVGAVADSFPAGLEGGLLARLSRLAEEAGAEAPIFNALDRSASPAPLRQFRLLTVEGEFRGGTRDVARFLERLQEVRVPVVLDSMALVRAVPDNIAHFRLQVLEPASGPSPEDR